MRKRIINTICLKTDSGVTYYKLTDGDSDPSNAILGRRTPLAQELELHGQGDIFEFRGKRFEVVGINESYGRIARGAAGPAQTDTDPLKEIRTLLEQFKNKKVNNLILLPKQHQTNFNRVHTQVELIIKRALHTAAYEDFDPDDIYIKARKVLEWELHLRSLRRWYGGVPPKVHKWPITAKAVLGPSHADWYELFKRASQAAHATSSSLSDSVLEKNRSLALLQGSISRVLHARTTTVEMIRKGGK